MSFLGSRARNQVAVWTLAFPHLPIALLVALSAQQIRIELSRNIAAAGTSFLDSLGAAQAEHGPEHSH